MPILALHFDREANLLVVSINIIVSFYAVNIIYSQLLSSRMFSY